MRSPIFRLLALLLFTGLYVLAGKFGLSLAFVHASASPVWPPTGIALASMLLFGYWFWPGIWIGAFIVNLTTAGSVASSMGIATGNTLEALAACFLLNRFAQGRQAFESTKNIFKYLLLATGLSTAVSATLGVTSLSLGRYANWEQFGLIWFTWWMGDGVSTLIITPLLVIWAKQPVPRLGFKRAVEGLLLVVSTVLTSRVIFEGWGLRESNYAFSSISFLSLPLLLWAAFRFGRHGATLTALLISGVALWDTWLQLGTLAAGSRNTALLMLQTFMGTVSLTGLISATLLSELRETEKAIQERKAEERFHAVSETALDAIVSADSNGKITYLNKAAEQMFGYTAFELAGEPLTRLMPGRYHKMHTEGFNRYLHTGESRLIGKTAELEGRRRDGTEFPLDISLAAWKAEGKTFFTGIMRDISERKRIEEALQKAYSELEFRVKERTQELQVANERLKKSDEMKSYFVSAASHELKTPLTAILGYIKLLLGNKVGPLNETQKEFLTHALKGANRQEKLLNNLLSLSKIESGKVGLEIRETDIEVLIREEVNLFETQAAQKEIALNLEITAPLGPLDCDPDRVREILENLISNALKYTPRKGKVRVTAACLPNKAIQMKVQDNGIGIKPEEQAKIFNPFCRLRASGLEGEESTGLGLSLVKRIVEAHQGEISVESREGSGSTFIVTLPAHTSLL